MEKMKLVAEKRTVLGKKLKSLRRKGFLPGNIYGKGMDSQSVQIMLDAFIKTFKKAKGTHVVYLAIGKEEYPVLIQNVHRDPISGKHLHVDLKSVDLKVKTETAVPIEIVGELAVVKSGEADVLVLSDRIMVKCLPTEIPEKIIVDISKLEGVGSSVHIKDLPKNTSYDYAEDLEKSLVEIVAAQKQEVVAPPVVEEAPVEGAAAAPTDAPKAGEAKPPAKAPEKKEEKK